MSSPGLCAFCLENILSSDASWAYHHPSQASLANSAHRGCTFCTLLHEDVRKRREILHKFETQDHNLKRWLHEDVAKADQLPLGCGSPTSLFRWSSRTLGRTRESRHSVAITFRVCPKLWHDQNGEHLETFGLPERVFYCFPESELGKLSSAAELGTSTDPSVNGGQQIKSWIRNCGIDHKHCPKRAGSGNKFVPTRLLHIGGKRPGDPIRIVNTKLNKIKGPYVTLSHCWGDPKLLEECTLRSKTLEEFMFIGVPWSKLSINFKQAIEIARYLEIDYIWIDSLCIMQGDKDDWIREGSLMHKVYRNSYCNIAAADAKDSKGGLFREREPYQALLAHFDAPEESLLFGKQRWRVVRGDVWDHDLLKRPLYSRGWVYQERMLAPRIIHFSKDQIFWDCTAMSACESFPGGLPLPLDQQSATDRHWRSRLQESTRGSLLLTGEADESLDEFWKLTVKDYTSLDLTNQGDKQLAIWGVAKRVRDTLDEEYAAGMWEDCLEEQLAWRVASCRKAERPQKLAAIPTWSWTSMKGTILISERAHAEDRSYRVTDHFGQPLSLMYEDDDHRPGLPRKASDNPEDMGRLLDLIDERRRKSSATVRHNSHPDPRPTRGNANDSDGPDVFSPGKNLGRRTVSPSSNIAQPITSSQRIGPVERHDSISDVDERRDKEPELKDSRISVLGYLPEALLTGGDGASQWTLEMPGISEEQLGRFEMDAFPDVLPETDKAVVSLLILVLTQHSDQEKRRYRVEEEASAQQSWYEGKGIMLRRSDGASDCYERVGAVNVRHMSPQWWYRLQQTGTTSSTFENNSEVEGRGFKLFLV